MDMAARPDGKDSGGSVRVARWCRHVRPGRGSRLPMRIGAHEGRRIRSHKEGMRIGTRMAADGLHLWRAAKRKARQGLHQREAVCV